MEMDGAVQKVGFIRTLSPDPAARAQDLRLRRRVLSAALTARFDGAVGPEVSKGSASIIIMFIDFLDSPVLKALSKGSTRLVGVKASAFFFEKNFSLFFIFL